MASNSSSAVLGLFVLLQLAGFLALALGSLYLLYCLSRAASSLDRMASVAEAWLVWQQTSAQKPHPSSPPAPAQSVTPFTPIPETPIPETPIPETPIPETPIPETLVPEPSVPATERPESPFRPAPDLQP